MRKLNSSYFNNRLILYQSTGNSEFLNDKTGNRRYWTIKWKNKKKDILKDNRYGRAAHPIRGR